MVAIVVLVVIVIIVSDGGNFDNDSDIVKTERVAREVHKVQC